MKKIRFNSKIVNFISVLILIVSLVIVYIILIPKNRFRVYSNAIDTNTLITIQNLLRSQEKFLFTKTEFISLLEKSDSGLKPSFVEINPDIPKEKVESVIDEILFLEYLIDKSPKKANNYIDGRLYNLETDDWSNLVIYAKAEKELKSFNKNKSEIIKEKENSETVKLINKDFGLSEENNLIVTLNNKQFSNTISNNYNLNLAIVRFNLENNKNKLPLMSDTKYQGIYPAYTNKDCNDRVDQYGLLKGLSTKEFNCEYSDANLLEVQVMVKEGQEENPNINNQIQNLDGFISSNLKNIKVLEESKFNQELADKLELTEEKITIVKLSTEIEKTPVYTNLLDNGIIKKIDKDNYLIL